MMTYETKGTQKRIKSLVDPDLNMKATAAGRLTVLSCHRDSIRGEIEGFVHYPGQTMQVKGRWTRLCWHVGCFVRLRLAG